jgi:hypothetical protein
MKTKTIYRIENPVTHHGMWYDANGNYDPVIKKLCPNGITKDIPMPFNNEHQKDGYKWYSAGKSIENMHQWFSSEDAQNLLNNGFKLFKFKVTMYQEKDMEILFCREGIIESKEIPLEDVWKDIKA